MLIGWYQFAVSSLLIKWDSKYFSSRSVNENVRVERSAYVYK